MNEDELANMLAGFWKWRTEKIKLTLAEDALEYARLIQGTKVLSETKTGDRFMFKDYDLHSDDQFYEVLSQNSLGVFCLTPSGRRQYYSKDSRILLWSPRRSQDRN